MAGQSVERPLRGAVWAMLELLSVSEVSPSKLSSTANGSFAPVPFRSTVTLVPVVAFNRPCVSNVIVPVAAIIRSLQSCSCWAAARGSRFSDSVSMSSA